MVLSHDIASRYQLKEDNAMRQGLLERAHYCQQQKSDFKKIRNVSGLWGIIYLWGSI